MRVSIPAHSPGRGPCCQPAPRPAEWSAEASHDNPADEFLSVTLHLSTNKPEAMCREDLIPQIYIHQVDGRQTPV